MGTGESRIAASINLAKNAVVLLHHLCYASGNSEPQLPEGTLDQAKQRVDNFAAGFIEAGACRILSLSAAKALILEAAASFSRVGLAGLPVRLPVVFEGSSGICFSFLVSVQITA